MLDHSSYDVGASGEELLHFVETGKGAAKGSVFRESERLAIKKSLFEVLAQRLVHPAAHMGGIARVNRCLLSYLTQAFAYLLFSSFRGEGLLFCSNFRRSAHAPRPAP